jgi:protease I
MARILFLLADDFEDSELTVPFERLRSAGHDVTVAGKEAGKAVAGKRGGEHRLDTATRDVRTSDFDALVIPGGYSPDRLRTDPHAVAIVREMVESGRPVAAVCHAPSLLAEADVLRGRTVTSWPSIRTDLRNAGARVVDERVVVDGNVITSRKPDDLDDFVEAIIDALGS